MIKLQDMTSGYGGKKQLMIESLDLERGMITSIIGKNGSGKSTLLRTICGFLPYGGSIMLDGAELSRIRHRERAKRIAYLPQQLPVVQLRVTELVSHGRYARGSFAHAPNEQDREAVFRALELTAMADLSGRSVDTLSGGERARAYLAMVIAQDSDYLILDEPASDMDISHQQLLLQIFRQLTSRGKGIIVSSHDLPQSFSYSDRICLLSEGRLSAACAPKELAIQTGLLMQTLDVALLPTHDSDALYEYMLGKGERTCLERP